MLNHRYPIQGIDRHISRLQESLHTGLVCAWGLDEDMYQCYGRADKTPVIGGYKPEVYLTDGEYREMYLDDRYAALSFFAVGDSTTISGGDNITALSLIFFVHLGALAIRPAISASEDLTEAQKLDERRSFAARGAMECRADVQTIIGENLHGFTLEQVITGANVLQEYVINRPGQSGARGMKEFDMQPFHAFKVTGSIRYPKPQLHNFNDFN